MKFFLMIQKKILEFFLLSNFFLKFFLLSFFLLEIFFVSKIFRQKIFSLQNFSYKKISKIEKRQKKLLKMEKNGWEIDRKEPLPTVNRKLARPIFNRLCDQSETTKVTSRHPYRRDRVHS